MFGATTNHAPPPDSVRAIFGVGKGKPKGKPKRRSPRRQAKVEEEEGSDGEEITPGPTDHCKDMGIGMKQVLSNKPGTPVARIGTEKRGFTKLYTSKKDVCGKGGTLSATCALTMHCFVSWLLFSLSLGPRTAPMLFCIFCVCGCSMSFHARLLLLYHGFTGC